MFINGYPPSVCMEEESQPAGGGFQIRAGPFAKRDQDQDQDEEESERSIQSEIAEDLSHSTCKKVCLLRSLSILW